MQALTAHIQIFHSLRAKLCKKSTFSGTESTFLGIETKDTDAVTQLHSYTVA